MSLKDEMSKNKRNYLKKMTDNEMLFQLKDLEFKRVFQIWDDESKHWFRSGQKMEMIDSEGSKWTIEEIEKTKFSDEQWKTAFPKHVKSRSWTIQRNILNPEGEGSYQFPLTADKDIRAIIDNALAYKADPTQTLLKLVKTKNGERTVYSVLNLGLVTETNKVIPKPQEQVKMTLKPIGGIQITIPQKQPITREEQALIDNYKKMDFKGLGVTSSLQLFAQYYTQNKDVLGVIGDERLRELFSLI